MENEQEDIPFVMSFDLTKQDTFIEQVDKAMGKPRKYNPSKLWKKFRDYITWCRDNPLWETKAFANSTQQVPKMRLVSQNGFCLFAGISVENLRRYKNGEHGAGAFVEVCAKIDVVINEIRNSGAAADMLNANFVARLQGLADKVDHFNYNSVPMTKEEIKSISKQLEDEL